MGSWKKEKRRVHEEYEHHKENRKKGKSKNSYECRWTPDLNGQLHSIESHQPSLPAKPAKPFMADKIKRVQQSCSNEFGSLKAYDYSFVSCDGGLNYEKICVENCKN